jgi:hypothetical protein
VYVPDQKRYETVTLNTTKFVVGEGAFVQVESDKNITVTKDGAFAAPRRTRAQANLTYDVRIAPVAASYTDRLFIKTTDSRENRYTVGQDLAKVSVSSLVPQMWIDRYDEKLCVNTDELINETANYPLGISVPENGTYQISSATEMQANQELYVTRNGSAIWNLAYGPYTVTLDKGTYSEYGIKLIQSNTPDVTTGVDQTQTTNDKLQIQKVLIDNKVYIVREGELYTITGQKVQ